MEEIISTHISSTQPSTDTEAGSLERWVSIVSGGALVLGGLQQRSRRGILAAVAGGGLVYQGAKKKSTLKQIGEGVGIEKAILVEKTVTINRPAPDLYSFWRQLDNLPRFMRHIKSVQVHDEHHSHWVVNAPLDQSIEWDAVIVDDQPDHLIAWASADDAEVDHSGFVRFQPAPGDRGTEVKVVMEYELPGGAMAAAIAKLFGEEPEQQIGDDLSRFKQLMETGEIATIVAVWGCGPVGQFAIRSAFMLGAERVIAIDRVPERLTLAQAGGAEILNYEELDPGEALKEMTGGRGPDCCIDAVGMEAHGTGPMALYDTVKQAVRLETGRPQALRQAIAACRKGGKVSVPGVYGGFIDKMPMGAFVNKGLTMRSGQTHVHKYLKPLLERVQKGDIDPSFLITH